MNRRTEDYRSSDVSSGCTQLAAASEAAPTWKNWPLLLFGVLFVIAACTIFFAMGLLASTLLLLGKPLLVHPIIKYAVMIGDAALAVGLALSLVDFFVLLPFKRQSRLVAFDDVRNPYLTVVLTAYNDEACIGQSVADFIKHPMVRRVIVVDNNSRDHTAEVARLAGAMTVIETKPGYGHCVYRALSEGLAQTDTDLTLLCEGDMTFRAFDISKFLAYIPHAEIVNGTRIVEQLRERDTQLTTFMYYGNFAVGKLLEAKYLGQGTFTDVGTTYKLCRNGALARLLPKLEPSINLSFNAHFLDTALRQRCSILECPITFHKRGGISKGGNTNNFRAFSVGLSMIKGIVISWKN